MSGSAHPTDEQLWLDEPSALLHVEECAMCRDVRSRLRRSQQAVADVLAAATPQATTMPETVERRLVAALQSEVRSGVAHQVAPATEHRTSRRTSAWAGFAAAAAVLVLVGTVVGVQQTSDPVAGGSRDGDALVESSEASEAAQAPADAARSGTADSDDEPAPPPIPPALVDQAQGSDTGRAEGSDTCGVGVLADPGDVVVAVEGVTTDPRGGVLVTVDGSRGRTLWWLPSCAAGADDALGRSALR